MKTVFVCFYESYPPACGAAAVTYGMARHARGERVLVHTTRKESGRRSHGELTVVSIPDTNTPRWRKVFSLRSRVMNMARTVEAERPDVVMLEGASWAPYHWLLLRRLRRTLPGTAIVYHSHNVEYHLRRQKHGRLVAAITRKAEGAILRAADLSFAVSEVDRQQFRELYGVEMQLLPNGVDVDRFTETTDAEVEDAKRRYGLRGQSVLFMGPYYYRPNREAIDFLVHEVFPRVLERCPKVTLVILGSPVPYTRPWLVSPGLIPHEHVPSIVRGCHVGLAPIFSGSGTRLKILEYLAAGRAVVATAKGAEGIEIEHGQNILLAEGAEAFADAMALLLSDTGRAEELGHRGQELVRERYAWQVVIKGMDAALASLRGGRRANGTEVMGCKEE